MNTVNLLMFAGINVCLFEMNYVHGDKYLRLAQVLLII